MNELVVDFGSLKISNNKFKTNQLKCVNVQLVTNVKSLPGPVSSRWNLLLQLAIILISIIGCGQHIEEALEGVPKEERCVCPGIFARIKAAFGF